MRLVIRPRRVGELEGWRRRDSCSSLSLCVTRSAACSPRSGCAFGWSERESIRLNRFEKRGIGILYIILGLVVFVVVVDVLVDGFKKS